MRRVRTDTEVIPRFSFSCIYKNKSHSLVFHWATFTFDAKVMVASILTQCCRVEFICLWNLVLMMGESDCCIKPSPSHPRDSQWVKVWTLWLPGHVWSKENTCDLASIDTPPESPWVCFWKVLSWSIPGVQSSKLCHVVFQLQYISLLLFTCSVL